MALALSGISLLVAVIFPIRQERLQSRVTDIEEARRAEEVASRLLADVTVSLAGYQGASLRPAENTFLVLENRGPAVAEDVDMEFQADGWHRLEGGARLPVTLDVGQRFPVQVVVTQ